MFQSATLNDQRVFHIIPQKLVPWLGPEKWTISPVRQSWRIWPAWHLWSFWIFPEMPSFGTPRGDPSWTWCPRVWPMTDEDHIQYTEFWYVGKETAQARPISPYLRVTVRIFAAVPGYSDLHPATCWECDRGKKKTIARHYWTILVCCWVYTYVWNLSIYIQMVLKHLAKEVCTSDPWTFRRKQILIIRLRSYVEVGYMEIVPILTPRSIFYM